MTQQLRTRNHQRTELLRALTAPQGFGDATQRKPEAGAIELVGGIPDANLLPTAELSDATARVLKQSGAPALQYGHTQGWPELIDWISRREQVPTEEILITNGGFHGLYLAISLLVERGGKVAVDNPAFPLFLRGLELRDAQLVPIGVDEFGLDVDELEEKLRAGTRIDAVYTVPDFHNPTQVSLSSQRRLRLALLAEEFDFYVIADNPYREITFGPAEDTTVFNTSDRVIHVNTFTKTLGPGLRLGWIRLPHHLVADAIALRSRQDSHTSLLIQAIVAEYLNSSPSVFDDLMLSANVEYRRRSETLAAALDRELPGVFEITQPTGGFFLWPKIVDPDIDGDALADAASRHGVEYQRGSFFPSGPGSDAERHLRLCYSNNDSATLREAAARLAAAAHSLR